MSKSNTYWMYGKHPVISAINNPKRKYFELLVTKSCKESLAGEFVSLTNNIGCNVRVVENKELENITKLIDVPHQGIALKVAPLEPQNIKQLLKDIQKPKSVIVALDGITDPQNVGAIIRSSTAFDVDAVMIPKTNSSIETPALVKAAVGNYEKVPICVETNLSTAFEVLKKEGYWIFGLDGYAKENISLIKKYDKVVIVLGSEGEGIRKLVKENCDVLVQIPIKNTESLNVSNAAAIALYEVNRGDL